MTNSNPNPFIVNLAKCTDSVTYTKISLCTSHKGYCEICGRVFVDDICACRTTSGYTYLCPTCGYALQIELEGDVGVVACYQCGAKSSKSLCHLISEEEIHGSEPASLYFSRASFSFWYCEDCYQEKIMDDIKMKAAEYRATMNTFVKKIGVFIHD